VGAFDPANAMLGNSIEAPPAGSPLIPALIAQFPSCVLLICGWKKRAKL
jgi:hypothetical protein